MSIELTVPEVGESITEVQIGRWLKADGDTVQRDEDLVEIETEKASVVVAAPDPGVLTILRKEGELAQVGDAIARIAAREGDDGTPEAVEMEARAAEPSDGIDEGSSQAQALNVMPAAARLLEEHGLDSEAVPATGPGGRLLKEDVQRYIEQRQARSAARATLENAQSMEATTSGPVAEVAPGRTEEVRPMSMIRRTIANRLVEAQSSAALLTTFNEIDMGAVMELRRQHKDEFETTHGVRLGFMSFFVKASVEALKRVPAVNAEVRGNDIVYRSYQDIGIAIGGGKGLVVPVLRNAETLSFALIESGIADMAARALENRIQPDELQGGTFTISNGGIYGSLLSTPIVNPPQSGILGMHAIQERPVARDGEVMVRPMMYVALTYDHRLIDGREAVTFLKTVKHVIETPARLLLEI